MPWKPDYLLLTDAKSYLRITDTVDDVELAVAITAVSRLIDTACNRQFGLLAAPAARTYGRAPLLNNETGLWELEIDDVQTTTGLLVNGTAYASSGGTLLPYNAPADGLPWTRLGVPSWPIASYPGSPVTNVITAQWGWTSVPGAVPMAARLQLGRLGFRRDAPQGIAGSPDQGSELRMLAKLDPDVIKLLGTVSRRRRAA
jgi:hypothetical protein